MFTGSASIILVDVIVKKLDAEKPESLHIMKDSQDAFSDSVNWSNVVDYMVP
jgi:hypothetical protein